MRALLLMLAACTPFTNGGGPFDAPVEGGRFGSVDSLLISEVMDHPTNGYKYVEICNRSAATVDLDGVFLERFANGNTSGTDVELTGTLGGGESLVLLGTSGEEAFLLDHGAPPSLTSSVVSGNGDDVYRLVYNGETLDLYGLIGVDGTNEAWEYTDSNVHRSESVTGGQAVFDLSQWEILPDVAGTPFACGAPIEPEPTPEDTAVPEPEPEPQTGSLMITEIGDHAVQSSIKYVEICNRSQITQSLAGMALHRYTNGSTEPAIEPLNPVLLQPGQAYVIANSSGQSDFVSAFGFAPQQTSFVPTGNGDDAYALAAAGNLTDVYGVIGVDGTGQPWEYTDKVTQRADDTFIGRTTWEVTEWTTGSAATATPGECAGSLVIPDDPDPTGDGDCADGDGDGYGSCIDCDDNDIEVHPGAIEACDGIDNDCDGTVPEGDVDANFDGVLDCEVCDEEGLWHATQNLYGWALESYLRNYSSNVSCGWNSSRRVMFGRIDAHNRRVQCVYTDDSARARFDTTTGSLNTEHTWPQSLGAGSHPAKCDLHHLYPTNMQANSARSSHPFGVPSVVTWSDGESRLGRRGNEVVFEPPDDHKGNVARSLFYMSITYNLSMNSSYRSRMKGWAALDPVDLPEQERTQRIGAEQGNVNPLVACPHLLDRL